MEVLIFHSVNSDSLQFPSTVWGPMHIIGALVGPEHGLDDVYLPVAWVNVDDLEHAFIVSQNLTEVNWLTDLDPEDVAPSRRENRLARSTSVGDLFLVQDEKTDNVVRGKCYVVMNIGFQYLLDLQVARSN